MSLPFTRVVSLSTLVLAVSTAYADVITVDDDGTADFDSIQAAVDYASSGDEIIVAPGVYTSDHPLHVVDLLGKEITLRASGGPAMTSIDGEGLRRGIVFLNGETAGTVIEGFTIRNGFGVEHDFDLNGSEDWWESSGGGVLVRQAGPMIVDCRFEDNSAPRYGGGMCNFQAIGTALVDCRFTDNSVSRQGGGLCNSESTQLTLKGCEFIGNSSEMRAGGMYNYLSSPEVINSTFRENFAQTTGGGLMNHFGSSPELTDCTFIGNATGSSPYSAGGGMVNYVDCSPSLKNCSFSQNVSVDGGGIWNYDNSNPTMDGCRLENNSASRGGGMHSRYSSSPMVVDCVFADNLVDGQGGGIYSYGELSRPILAGTTVCGNAPDQISGDWTESGGNDVSDTCAVDCPGDISGDGIVDGGDLTYLLSAWGTNDPVVDVNDDGIVDGNDLTIILASWGPCS